MFVVILQNGDNLVELCAGNKDRAFPIVNHAPGKFCGALRLILAYALHRHATLLQSCVGVRSLRLGQFIDPQKCPSAQSFLIARLDLGYIILVAAQCGLLWFGQPG